MDKENEAPITAPRTPPLPVLVPMGDKSGRKSSVKKVRFSLDTDNTPVGESSPIRLNRDILGEDVPNNRQSIAGRRSSIGLSDSPLHFPSQEELMAGGQSNLPVGSPSDSRQSTGSSVNGVLGSALNSFAMSNIIPDRPRSIWDTPSSSAKKPSASRVVPLGLGQSPPARRTINTPGRSSLSSETPGKAEQKMFGFQVVLGVSSSDPPLAVTEESSSPVVVVPPRSAEPQQDDPMLLSGASSRVARRMAMTSSSVGSELATPASSEGTTSRRRRRRRLSHLEDMESELLNVSSPEHVKLNRRDMTLREALIQEGIDVQALVDGKTVQSGEASTSSAEPDLASEIDDPVLLSIVDQQQASMALTLESAIDWVKDLLEKEKKRAKDLLADPEIKNVLATEVKDPEMFRKILSHAEKEGQAVCEKIELRVLENQLENVVQTAPALASLVESIQAKQEQAESIVSDAESLGRTIAEMKEQLQAELEEKLVYNQATNTYERKMSDAERRLNELDSFVKEKEAAILEAITEINSLEAAVGDKQEAYSEGFSRMRQFYLNNGWNVICQVQGSLVLVYAVCHILVFEKAKNNSAYWRLDRIVPAKMDPNSPPFYAPHVLSDQLKFNSQLVLSQIVESNNLNIAFEYDPYILHDLMGAAVTALCEWTQLRENIARCLPTSESRAKINTNLQIEIALVIMNKSLGDDVEVPMLVKLLWFDPILSSDNPVRFDNFSFIACEAMLAYFPFVKTQIDERLALIKPTDVYSSALLGEIVKAVTSVLVNAQLSVPSYA